jgi:membrane protein implicated in regulation of membrane protease activity
MSWWLWVVIGILLVGIELLSPGGFYVIFFGFAALLVGAMRGLGLAEPLWLQWLLFSVLAIGSLLLFRQRLLKRLPVSEPGVDVDSLIGELALPVEAISPGAVGKVELRGSTWDARNGAADPVAAGSRCRVQRVDGFMLTIAPE